MYLHLCPECEKGNHVACWRTQPSHPPGSYGGSKCRCGCDGHADYGKPLTIDDVDMFDEPNGSENTVSNLTRRYTSQWGLPPARDAMLKNRGISTNQCPAPTIAA